MALMSTSASSLPPLPRGLSSSWPPTPDVGKPAGSVGGTPPFHATSPQRPPINGCRLAREGHLSPSPRKKGAVSLGRLHGRQAWWRWGGELFPNLTEGLVVRQHRTALVEHDVFLLGSRHLPAAWLAGWNLLFALFTHRTRFDSRTNVTLARANYVFSPYSRIGCYSAVGRKTSSGSSLDDGQEHPLKSRSRSPARGRPRKCRWIMKRRVRANVTDPYSGPPDNGNILRRSLLGA